MLRNLHIKNLALIKEIDVDFSKGLNILTGETGAGKSILIDSISLALGSRMTRDMTHPKEAALSELVFEVDDEDTLTLLAEKDVIPEDGQIVISRRLLDGRSTIRVNAQTRTAAEVRSIAGLLLDIHGQSEHQKLLHSDVQLSLLDEYGKDEIASARQKTAECYRSYAALKRELGDEELSEEERARRSSFLEFEINEIEEAQLQVGEDEEVEQRYKKLLHARKIADAVEEVHNAAGYDSNGGAGEIIGAALRKLNSVLSYDESLEELAAQLTDIDNLLNDFNRSISDYADDLSFEAQSFEETEERLNLINKLKTKYGNSIEQILQACADKKQELQDLTEYVEHRQHLKAQFAVKEEHLRVATESLSALRQKYAAGFAKDVTAQLLDLNFAKVDFAVEISEAANWSANGRDVVRYMISTNPGAPRGLLQKVVSGGELSRIMLGIRTMFADSDATDTLIFDEIDTGISGRTAQKVAEKLSQVARHHQVLCITHLPQIAAMADAHYGITKSVLEEGAVTHIAHLNAAESVDELARMLGGAEITENTRNSAQEMKEMCRQFKADVL